MTRKCSVCKETGHTKRHHTPGSKTRKQVKREDPVALDYSTISTDLFGRAGEGRGNNDSLNKKREIVLETILGVSDDVLPSYWKEFKEKWRSCLSKLYEGEFDTIKVSKRAGRGHNHDFHISFVESDRQVHEANIEFKHNARTIESLPQFLSLSEKKLGYAPYYYDNYLKKYVDSDSGITEPIPDKTLWLTKVYSTNYTVLPFIEQLKNREHIEQKKKSDIVNESISKFLESHGDSIDLKWLSEEFKRTQDAKKFVLWDLREFYVYDPLKDFGTLKYAGIKNGNAILVNGETTQYSLLLRWRNHKGILLPAWQISLKPLKRSEVSIPVPS